MCNFKPGHHRGTIMLQLQWYVVEQHGIGKKMDMINFSIVFIAI